LKPFPEKKYKIILADPAWSYESGVSPRRGIWGLAQYHYNTMTNEDIKNLPVKDIADKDCILFLWATFPNIQVALDTVKAWGFEYKTVAFVWEKTSKSNMTLKKFGLGWYTRSNVEVVLLGRKGKFDRKSAAVQQVIKSTIGKHSQKPHEVRKRILKLCGDLPRIELFARSRVHGWDTWGNDPKLDSKPLEDFLEH